MSNVILRSRRLVTTPNWPKSFEQTLVGSPLLGKQNTTSSFLKVPTDNEQGFYVRVNIHALGRTLTIRNSDVDPIQTHRIREIKDSPIHAYYGSE